VIGVLVRPARAGRVLLFAFFQALVAAFLALQGQANPWYASAAWWPVSVTLANLTCLLLLDGLMRREGLRLLDLYRVEKHVFWRELLLCLSTFIVGGPISFFPNILVGQLLFSDPARLTEMMFRPLPLGVVLVSMVLFPLTIALSELPTYLGYAMPRLTVQTGSRWWGFVLPVFMLSTQHVAFPLIFDGRFLLWRFLMFLPFALWVGLIVRWRPRLLPYVMVIHALMDLTLFMYLLPIAIR